MEAVQLMKTIDQLQAHYSASYLYLEVLLRDHFTHIASTKYFIKQVKAGRINLKLSRLDDTKKAPYIVWLTDLADYLDQRKQSRG